jgi:hypothetical protein
MTDEVFDLDALAAEATSRALRFTYAGREWQLAHVTDFDWRVTRDGISGDMEAVDTIFRRGLGAEQYAQWEQVEQPTHVVSALFDRWLEHCGLSRGKSESSTDSSESTEKPLKPASKPRTKSASAGSSTARSRRAASSS